jgi:hypothetical protein
MEARTARLLGGALAVCCLALVLAVGYPFSVSEPHAAAPADERFGVGHADAYRVTGEIVVDGETELAVEGVVTGDGERYQIVRESGVRSERYQASPDGPVYERIAVDRSEAPRLRAQIAADEARRLVRENRTAAQTVFVVERNTTGLAESIAGSASVVVRSLHVVSYERRANGPVYEPQNGWYDGRETYRITAASGTVRTDATSTAVESATVTWAVTDPAGTYAEYALVRLTGDDPRTYEISYEFDAGASDVDRPAWVNETWAAAHRPDDADDRYTSSARPETPLL